jgi:hypothetical protein
MFQSKQVLPSSGKEFALVFDEAGIDWSNPKDVRSNFADVERLWAEALLQVSDEDREHLEREAEGATIHELADMLAQVQSIVATEAEGGGPLSIGEEWRAVLEQVPDEDREHLERGAEGASEEELVDMLAQVRGILEGGAEGQEAGDSEGAAAAAAAAVAAAEAKAAATACFWPQCYAKWKLTRMETWENNRDQRAPTRCYARTELSRATT